jgi:hypothetical protein
MILWDADCTTTVLSQLLELTTALTLIKLEEVSAEPTAKFIAI